VVVVGSPYHSGEAGSEMAHIDRTSSSGHYLAVLQRMASMGVAIVGNWGMVIDQRRHVGIHRGG